MTAYKQLSETKTRRGLLRELAGTGVLWAADALGKRGTAGRTISRTVGNGSANPAHEDHTRGSDSDGKRCLRPN